ncbi:MAG: 4-(cytidine 5'-diphospho)-2-C-methyl-D-erythritol kinase [bacterium]
MVRLKSFAKINLNLNVLPKKLKNGLFPVKYINCQIALFDDLQIEKNKDKIIITSNHKDLPKLDENLIYKAINLLKSESKNKNLGIKINLKKNIPIRAGFGGGSSNATAALLAVIKLWNLKINNKQLLNIADNLGKEVFYFLKGGVCEVLHDGSIVNKLSLKIPKVWLVAVGPKQKKPSTEYMFKNLKPKEIGKSQNKFYCLKKALIKKNKKLVIQNLHNDFEALAIKKYPELNKIKADLIKNKALNATMTGAGLYMIGYFDKKEIAKKAYNKLKKNYKSIIFTHTI